jgi:hypothetical protein
MRALLAVQELAPRLAERIVAATAAGKSFAGLRQIGNYRSAPGTTQLRLRSRSFLGG